MMIMIVFIYSGKRKNLGYICALHSQSMLLMSIQSQLLSPKVMGTPILILLLLVLSSPFSCSTSDTLSIGSSLSVEKPDEVLVSSNGIFSAGFYPVGDNAYCFAIWFSKPNNGGNLTVVWMANRDQPVNGRYSKLSLLKTGNLILTDAGRSTVWATDTVSVSLSSDLRLHDNGNLVLHSLEGVTWWQSFDYPTDTLLPHQPLSKNTKLVSSRSRTNYSSGFYKLFFDNDNILRLLFDSHDTSSIYWPYPWLVSWEAGRSTYNNSRIAMFNSLGNFSSSDDCTFLSIDYGAMLQRRLTMDFDGNLRLYSQEESDGTWVVSWQAISDPCKIHGVCGVNCICSYVPSSGRKCSCIPGFKMKNHTDWSYGCEPKLNLSCNNKSEVGFIKLPHSEFYGYDYGFFPNYTFEKCEKLCLDICNCKGFQYKLVEPTGFQYKPLDPIGLYNCYPKTLLLNGHYSPGYKGDLYVKVSKASLLSYNNPAQDFTLECSGGLLHPLDRTYVKSHENGKVKFMLWFATAFGGIEIIVIFMVWCFLIRTHQNTSPTTGFLAVTGFKRFTYSELKKATKNFSEEIGRGAGGIVYKGVLSNHRVAAIKLLYEATQGEAEFLAEVSTIGKLNHMNVIEMWGYCAERKHRLLVYEYMEHGSLSENLSSNALDGKKRFEIALGTAKGLAYLHEECLEWVLHCDVKPQNILLDSNYQPKVADFGLSKLLNRGDLNKSSFSRVRGTRGYMAPEWVVNLPITSKVDVYSYGIVVMEMVTGKSPAAGVQAFNDGGETQHRRLLTWVREKMNGGGAMAIWMDGIIDPLMEGKYDMKKMEILVGVALQCVEEDRDSRPTMSQVVEMLLRHEINH